MDKYISNVGAYISALAAAALIISTTYDYGFLRYLGLTFRDIPTSLADHVRTSLVWVPHVVTAAIAIFLIELTTVRIEGGLSEEELVARSPSPRFTAWFRKSPIYPILASVYAVPVFYLLGMPLPVEAWRYSMPLVWLTIMIWVFNHDRIRAKTSESTVRIAKIAPAVLLFMVFHGATEAQRAMAENGESIFQTDQGTIKGVVVRTFGEFYLLADKAHDTTRILFIDHIVSVEGPK